MQGTSAAPGRVALRERARSIFVILALSKQTLFMCMGVVGVCTQSSCKNLYKIKRVSHICDTFTFTLLTNAFM